MRSAPLIIAIAACLLAGPASAFQRLEGCFVAARACAAPQSFRKGTNTGGVRLEPGRSYALLGANRARPTHLQLELPGAAPRERWVRVDCGRVIEDPKDCAAGGPRPPAADAGAAVDPSRPGRGPSGRRASHADNLLAVSWQPGFCETRPEKPECRSQTADRFDGSHFALHGLWPQPNGTFYCGVEDTLRNLDEAGSANWPGLPEPALSDPVRAELDEVMPGARSGLDRHEWLKHGTCYGATPDEYFAESLMLMRELNASAVRGLFAARIGEEVSLDEVRLAFEEAFGPGAGERVDMDCAPVDGVSLVVELRLNLRGVIDERSRLRDLIASAPPAGEDCRRGLVDAASRGSG